MGCTRLGPAAPLRDGSRGTTEVCRECLSSGRGGEVALGFVLGGKQSEPGGKGMCEEGSTEGQV